MTELQHTFDWKKVKIIHMVGFNMYNVQNQEQPNIYCCKILTLYKPERRVREGALQSSRGWTTG